MIYILTIVALYTLQYYLKSPQRILKLHKLLKPKTKIIKPLKIKNKPEKFVYKHIELSKFKLGKQHIKTMLSKKFIRASDPYQSKDKYYKSFVLSLENYLLYRYPTASMLEINTKLEQVINNNTEYWMDSIKQYV